MNRTESSANAATRQGRSPSVAAAPRGGTVPIATTVFSACPARSVWIEDDDNSAVGLSAEHEVF
jgi:hypothetical protein